MIAHHDTQVLDQLGLPPEQTRPVKLVAHADRLAELWDRNGLVGAIQQCEEVAGVMNIGPGEVRGCLSRAADFLKEELRVDEV